MLQELSRAIGAVGGGELTLVFPAGLLVGSLVDRLARRLPLEMSVWWPAKRHCRACRLPLPWWANLPLVGPVLAKGRCSQCDSWLPWRRVVIELTVACFLTLLYAVRFGLRADGLPRGMGEPVVITDQQLVWLFVYQAILVFFLMVAAFVDFETMTIPDSITVPGMILGLVLGTVGPSMLHPISGWPRDTTDPEVWHRKRREQFDRLRRGPDAKIRQADDSKGPAEVIQDNGPMSPTTMLGWAFSPIRPWLQPTEGEPMPWQGRFLTALMGLLLGGAFVAWVRWICSTAFGREALGTGDITLMAMAGAFVGWQTVVIAFFVAPLSAVVVGGALWILRGQQELPFGPHLGFAVILCLFVWRPLWHWAQLAFVNLSMFAVLMVMMSVMLLVISWGVRVSRRTAEQLLERTSR